MPSWRASCLKLFYWFPRQRVWNGGVCAFLLFATFPIEAVVCAFRPGVLGGILCSLAILADFDQVSTHGRRFDRWFRHIAAQQNIGVFVFSPWPAIRLGGFNSKYSRPPTYLSSLPSSPLPLFLSSLCLVLFLRGTMAGRLRQRLRRRGINVLVASSSRGSVCRR